MIKVDNDNKQLKLYGTDKLLTLELASLIYVFFEKNILSAEEAVEIVKMAEEVYQDAKREMEEKE